MLLHTLAVNWLVPLSALVACGVEKMDEGEEGCNTCVVCGIDEDEEGCNTSVVSPFPKPRK